MSNPVVSTHAATGGSGWSFRRAEWHLLVTLPGRVVIAAASARHDPARRTVVGGLVGLDAVAAGRSSASRLVRDVVSAVYHEPDDRPTAVHLHNHAAGTGDVLAGCRQAARVLTERVDHVDADAYRHWILAIATRVCHAARTRGLLAVGGAVVSATERRFLADLAAALEG